MKNRIFNISVFIGIAGRASTVICLSCFMALFAIISGCNSGKPVSASDVILLVNSGTQAEVAITKVIPYLDHFGVKYKTIDIAMEALPSNADPALIIIGHSEIAPDSDLTAQLEQYLKTCQSRGTGILSFDPLMPSNLLSQFAGNGGADSDVGELRFSEERHYITEYRNAGETKELFGYMSIPKMSVKEKEGRAIITGNDLPLLVVGKQGKVNVAQWTSQDWMYYSILGPVGGLDDCLWKSMVWAARKPFIMHALPPIATLRVDDVVGSGRQQWNVTPFHWVKTANKYGFKPWMGLFIYNITPEGIEELKELMPAGLADGTPHAFGRPPRKESQIETIVNVYNPYYAPQMAAAHFVPDYWYSDAIPYLSKYYDEFIFFDHNNQKPWDPEISKKTLKAVDDWYRSTGLPMGKYLVAHWGEISANMMAYIYDNWGTDIMDNIREVDKSWGQQTLEYNLKEGEQPIRSSPFRLYDEPEIGKKKENAMTARAFYIASFREWSDRPFFNFCSIIFDLTGFEWQPDNDVEATADRGIKILSRGLESKILPVLFTHETDYIYAVKPENWDAILKKVSEGISKYNPAYLTTDDAVKMVRAYSTSEIQNGVYDRKSGELILKMSGKTDVPTGVFVYTDNHGSVNEKFVEIPVFENELLQTVRLSE